MGGGGGHKSEDRCFLPVRKGRGEVGVSKKRRDANERVG